MIIMPSYVGKHTTKKLIRLLLNCLLLNYLCCFKIIRYITTSKLLFLSMHKVIISSPLVHKSQSNYLPPFNLQSSSINKVIISSLLFTKYLFSSPSVTKYLFPQSFVHKINSSSTIIHEVFIFFTIVLNMFPSFFINAQSNYFFPFSSQVTK